MCLQKNDDQTAVLASGTWPIKAFKILQSGSSEGGFFSPYRPYSWHVGDNISDRPTTEVVEERVAQGIHVLLHKEHAEGQCCHGHVVAELICEKEHFVAAGMDEGYTCPSAVFTQVHLSQEAYDELLRQSRTLLPGAWDEYEDEDDDDWEDDEYEDEDEDDWDDDEDDDYRLNYISASLLQIFGID